jgi:polyribonucleotide nucleotidyltransferase
MGLVKENGQVAILSDIIGDEDHYGDMDFKIAGTQRGITALQMDCKVAGLSEDVLRRALEQAREGRLHILRRMLETLDRPRHDISVYAPRLVQIIIPVAKIGAVIGPGGRVIRSIEEETGAKVEVEDDGTITISSVNAEDVEKAKAWIEGLTEEAEVGKTYEATVVSIRDFGAFAEFLPGQDGMIHVSELDDGYVERVEDVLKVGDVLKVKVIKIDEQGRVKLSRKAVLRDERRAAGEPDPDDDRGPRRNDRGPSRRGDGRRGDGRRGGDRRRDD